MKLRTVTLSLLLPIASAVLAAEAAPRVLTDVPYLGPDRAEKLDVYLPASQPAGAKSPAVVWIHGGGWTGGTKNEARAKKICTTLTANGYVAVSIDYKLGKGSWPTDLLDCKNAVRFLRANASKYQVDPDRIAVAGGSAGGHLACMVGLTTGETGLEPDAPYSGVSSAVRCVIDMYGPIDLLTRQETTQNGEPTGTRKLVNSTLSVFGAKDASDPVLQVASAISHVRKDSPPVLIMHGRADNTVDYPQSEELAAVLAKAGVPHELVLLDGIGHTFDWEMWARKPLPRDLRPVALGFLAKYMGK